MAKKLTKAKAREILHDKEVHGHPLTDKQRKFFGAVSSGYIKAQNGIEGTMGGLTDIGFNFNPAWGGAWENGGLLKKAQGGTKVKDKDQKWIQAAATQHQKCGIGTEDPKCKTEPNIEFPGMPSYENMSNPSNLWNWPQNRKEQKAFINDVDARYKILSQQYSDLTKETLIATMRDSARTNQLLNNQRYMRLFDDSTGKLKDSTLRIEDPYIKYWKQAYPQKTKITVPDMLQNLGQNIGNYSTLINSGYKTFEDGGILKPAMAGAHQTVPMYAIGGNIPGSVGFTYARIGAPSNGPHAKKTLASAQNGQEMSFYQAGLDFTPKTISKNGGWLDKYNEDIPQAQGGIDILPGYAKQYLAGNQGDIPRPSAQKFAEQQRIDEYNKKMAAYNAANQGRTYVAPTKQLTPYEEQKHQEFRRSQLEQYAATHPEQKVNEFGDLTLSPYGEFTQKYGPNLQKFAESWETPLAIQGAGELLYGAGKLGAKYLPQVGEYLTTQTPLKNAYKLNPWAFKPNPEAYYRMLGKEGYVDALESGVIRRPINSSYSVTSYSKGKPWDKKFKGPYMVEAKNPAHFKPDFPGEVSSKYNIPISEKDITFYKQDWLKGYKEVPKSMPTSTNTFNSNFKSEIDWGKWNPETPKYPELINEYNAIEEATKANGTWMKNPDGSPFQGTPEQFIQQQSSHFKKAFPEGAGITYRGDRTHYSTINTGVTFSGDRDMALNYTYENATPFTVNSPLGTNPRSGQNIMSSEGLYELYYPKTKNSIHIDGKNRDYSNLPIEDNDILNYIKSRADYNKDKKIWTDDIADYIKSKDIDNATIGNIYDSSPKAGTVRINNNKSGNYLKSMWGNVGFFDMKNPNIYKGLVPAAVIGGATFNQKKQGGVVKDNRGQWAHPGKVTEIQGDTMATHGYGDIPLYVIPDNGEEPRIIYPNTGEHYFPGATKFTEYPIAAQGVSVNKADEYPLHKLDDLLNFTNYNKKAKNGWISKYTD